MARYKRSIFLINKPFQYKFSLMLCSLVFLCSLAYPLVIYGVFDALINRFTNNADQISDLKNTVLTWLIIYQLLFTALVFILGIFFSHKIAGPMYKLKNYLQGIQDGNEIVPIFFRNGDYFQEIAQEVNNTFEYLIEREADDVKYIKEVNSYLNNISLVLPEDKKPVLQEITARLAEIEERHKPLS